MIVLNIHAPTEDKTGDTDSFCNEPEVVIDKFPKHHMRIGDFSAKVCRDDIFKPTIGAENLHEIGNDNGARLCHVQRSNCQEYNVHTLQPS
jgi:hypothetical protein